MRRALLALVGVAVVVPVAWAAAAAIQPASIAGAKLGLTAAAYKRLLGRPVRKDVLENSYSRLVFTKRKVEVYFKGAVDKGVEITTWNKAYKTAAGIGPCSTVKQLTAAYGHRLGVALSSASGTVYAYLLGKLIFAANDGKHVTAVALDSGKEAIYIALSVTPCS
jgi:hypothetical protein